MQGEAEIPDWLLAPGAEVTAIPTELLHFAAAQAETEKAKILAAGRRQGFLAGVLATVFASFILGKLFPY